MLVQPINSVSFGQRSLSPKTFGQLSNILTKMNEQAVYVANDTNYKSSYLKQLRYNDFILTDARGLLKPVSKEKQLQNKTLIDTYFTQVVVNNENGEIVDSSKPFIVPWNKLLKNIEENIEFISKNFENTRLVQRIRNQREGLTTKGIHKQQKLAKDFKKLESEVLK